MSKELLSVAKALLEYIDAIPKSVVLPVMPGMDRDWVDQVISSAEATSVEESLLKLQPFFAMIGSQVNLYFDAPEKSAEFYEVMDRFMPERVKQ